MNLRVIDLHLSLFLLKIICLNGLLSLELIFGKRRFVKFTALGLCLSGSSKMLTFAYDEFFFVPKIFTFTSKTTFATFAVKMRLL